MLNFKQGHDTTTTAITFCLYNIAKYPEVQKKCFEECRSIFGDDKRTPTTLADLNNLSYLDLVIKESLRLFPSVPYIGRKSNEEILLSKFLISILFRLSFVNLNLFTFSR